MELSFRYGSGWNQKRRRRLRTDIKSTIYGRRETNWHSNRWGTNGTHPAEIKLFANDTLNKIDLENVHRKKPTQKFDIQEDFLGVLEYETDRTKFSACSSVTIFVSKNFANLRGEEIQTEISYVGLRGEASGNRRDMIVTAVYETRPFPEDHKVGEDEIKPRTVD